MTFGGGWRSLMARIHQSLEPKTCFVYYRYVRIQDGNSSASFIRSLPTITFIQTFMSVFTVRTVMCRHLRSVTAHLHSQHTLTAACKREAYILDTHEHAKYLHESRCTALQCSRALMGEANGSCFPYTNPGPQIKLLNAPSSSSIVHSSLWSVISF